MVTLGDQLLYWESRSIKPNVRCFVVFVFLRSKRQKKYNLYLPSAVVIAKVLVAPTKQLKEIIQTEHNIVKILTGRSQTSWLFTGVAEIWAPGYRETNPGNGQSETRIISEYINLRVPSPTRWPLDHAAFRDFYLSRFQFLPFKSLRTVKAWKMTISNGAQAWPCCW